MAAKNSQEKTENLEQAAELAADIDLAQLPPKTRLYALAKQLQVTSRTLVDKFAELGIKKAPQSALNSEEIAALVDSLVGAHGSSPTVPDEGEEAEQESDRLRQQVESNVRNEISQIERKVEAELAALVAEEADEGETDAEAAEDEANEEAVEDEADAGVAEDEAEVEVVGEGVGKQGATMEYAPLFLAPSEESAQEEPPLRRRGRRGTSRGRGVGEVLIEEPKAIKGSTRIEAQRRRRAEMREKGRERQRIVSEAEFLARREAVERSMVVRDKRREDAPGVITQVAVLEDDLLVEHFVASDSQASLVGNIYLGRVQNVLPSMEAAFVDFGQGRNGVLYASEVNWSRLGSGGRARRIESALNSGDQVLVQVTKDPIGHKGARLSMHISLPGRYLVYVPEGRSAGISRKLPAPERGRLKGILERVVPGKGGAIIRTAAENVSEEAIAGDVRRLHARWEDIAERAEHEKATKGAKPVTLYEEPDPLVKVVRDLFNEDFRRLVVDGKRSYNTVRAYIDSMAPELAERVIAYDPAEHEGTDAFETYRIEEQLQKALSRKVWLPSGGTLIVDRTEAMTVIDVNTGKFTGTGGNLEETVTRNNLEAAEEIVRQMRLRDLGGMIVVDFIDMVLPENQDLVLRRLKEALGRDRTRHQVSEVTSLGLVQMTRKRLGIGLLETFSTECEACHGRGLIIHDSPVNLDAAPVPVEEHRESEPKKRRRSEARKPKKTPLEDLVAHVVVEEPEAQEVSSAEIGYAAAANAAEEDEIEEFASYVPEEPQKPEDPQKPEEPQREEAAKPARTRKRRRAVRRRSAEQAPAAPVEVQEKSYEEALAEFEASPRRRRRTRGNSRSDHAPRREDFGEEGASPSPGEAPRRRAGRRRATRRRSH